MRNERRDWERLGLEFCREFEEYCCIGKTTRSSELCFLVVRNMRCPHRVSGISV
jgi:hypothetical protein